MFGTSSQMVLSIGSTTNSILSGMVEPLVLLFSVAVFLLVFGMLISGFAFIVKGLLK